MKDYERELAEIKQFMGILIQVNKQILNEIRRKK